MSKGGLELHLIKQNPSQDKLDYYSIGGKPIHQDSFVTLGFMNSRAIVEQVPVINIGHLKTKLSGQIKVTGLVPLTYPGKNKFIKLNGKSLMVVPQNQIPEQVKKMVKINSHILNPPKPLKMFKRSTSVDAKQTSTDKRLDEIMTRIKPNTVNSPGSQIDSSAEPSVNSLIDQYITLPGTCDELDLFPAIFSKSPKLLSGKNLKVLNEMKALNLSMKKDPEEEGSQQEKSVQTNINLLVDKGVQTDAPSIIDFESFDLLSMIESSNDGPLIRDVNIGMGPSIGKVEYKESNVPFYSEREAVMMSETKKKQLMFFTDLRECLNYNKDGNLPIHEGVIGNDVYLVQRNCIALKGRKTDVNIENHNGCTPLQLAVINNSVVSIVRILLDFNADITENDGDGNNILHLCAKFERLQILETILAHPRFKTKAISCLNSFNFEGLTPLMLCCISSCTPGAKLLINHGSDVNIRDQTSGRTALFHAAEAQNVSIVNVLLNFKADPKIKNFFGTSPHDAMYELDDMPEQIKSLIFGKSKKRSLEAELNPTRTAKAVKTMKTFSKLKKIEPKPAKGQFLMQVK